MPRREASGPGGRTAGDAARARGVRGDAGEVGSNDARGIAELMRLGWFRPVHCKSIRAQETRAVLTARKLVQSKLRDVENSLRGMLRGFGLKVGKTTERASQDGSASLWRAIRNLEVIAKALLAVHEVLLREFKAFEKRREWRDPTAGQAADVDAGGRPDRGPHLCQRDRRSDAVQIVEAGWSSFRADPKEVSVRRDRHTPAGSAKSAMPRCARRSTGRPHHAEQAGQRLLAAQELGDADRQARRHEKRRRSRWGSGSR